MSYVCSQLESTRNIYGGYDCKTWVEQSSFFDEIAITRSQASEITVAICSILILGWIFGEIGNLMKSLIRR